MKTDADSVAVVCDKHGPDAAAMQVHLASRAIPSPRWYALRDLDKLDTDVRDGLIRRVVFVRPTDLLEGIFNSDIRYSQWLAADAQVEFASSPSDDLKTPLAGVADAWERHQAARRRRQIVAGAIMGSIALLASFVVILT